MKTMSTVLTVLVLVGCAGQPPRTPDQLVSDAVIRCQERHATMPMVRSNGEGRTLHNEMISADYDRAVNLLRTAAGWDAVADRARRAQDPIQKFCTLEIAVRLDPAKARALYAEFEKNDDLGWYIARDEYLREALKPLVPARQDP